MLVIIALSIFVILEIANVSILYFAPDTTKANGMGIFKAWKDNDHPDLLHYMRYWVAGTKLIFLGLLIVILIFGDQTLQFYSLIVTVIAISSFYYKMYPLIRKMDKENQLIIQGYSATLGKMIAAFIIVLSIAGIVSLIVQ